MDYYTRRRSGFEKIIRSLERVTRPGRWLDAGCGPGILLEIARRRGWEAYGIDQSPACVRAARARLNGATVICGAIEQQLASLQGPFQVISFTDVLRYLPRPMDALEQCKRLLDAGGWLVLREIQARTLREIRAGEREGDPTYMQPLQEWSLGALQNALGLAGFRNVHSAPSPPFTEVPAAERGANGVNAAVSVVAKRLGWPVVTVSYALTAGRFCLSPNYLTLAQK